VVAAPCYVDGESASRSDVSGHKPVESALGDSRIIEERSNDVRSRRVE
jgi:hypothetical protein